MMNDADFGYEMSVTDIETIGSNHMGAAYPTLNYGSQGEDVKKLQTLLTAKGYNTQGIDGKFGPNTKDALNRYKVAVGMPADGVADGAVWSALESQTQAVASFVSAPANYNKWLIRGGIAAGLAAIALVIAKKSKKKFA
jgi:peptidoglycan hydrolase-like protein with peptidoglycan-binding domain